MPNDPLKGLKNTLQIYNDLGKTVPLISNHVQEYLDQINQHQRMLDDLRKSSVFSNTSLQLHKNISTILKPAVDISEYFKQFTDASNKHLGVTRQETIHPSWLNNINTFHNHSKSVLEFLNDKITASKKYFDSTIGQYLQTGYDNLDSLSYITRTPSHLLITHQNLIDCLNRLTTSITTPDYLFSLPDYTIPGANQDTILNSYAIYALQNNDEDNNFLEEKTDIASCRYFLEILHPPLLKLFDGAKQSLTSDNPDKVRHVLISLREIFTTVLHTLAPDKLVLPWAIEENLISNKRPTRLARIKFIYKQFNLPTLDDFIEADIKSILSLFAIFHRVHDINFTATSTELEIIFYRAASQLLYILSLPMILRSKKLSAFSFTLEKYKCYSLIENGTE